MIRMRGGQLLSVPEIPAEGFQNRQLSVSGEVCHVLLEQHS